MALSPPTTSVLWPFEKSNLCTSLLHREFGARKSNKLGELHHSLADSRNSMQSCASPVQDPTGSVEENPRLPALGAPMQFSGLPSALSGVCGGLEAA
jgi:hypothetical protein